MQQSSADLFEWHIFETVAVPSFARNGQGIHIGPFSTEEECRTVLTSIAHIPGFGHRCLEIRQQARRREKRIRIKLPIRLYRVSCPYQEWPANTLDISAYGARLSDATHSLNTGELIVIGYGQREAVFRVAWIGVPGSSTAGQVGVECLSPDINLWDIDVSDHGDDEPLLHEIEVARVVQRKLFPREKPGLQTLDYCGKCIQAHSVGGDYYDFLDMGLGRVGFVMADVAGKGVAAALLMANLQGSIHNRPDIDINDVPALLSSLNLHLYKHTEPDRYATLFFGCYSDHSRTLAYVNCGHSPALLMRANGALERLEATATVLGLFGKWECAVQQTVLKSGDLLSLFTDGITETTSAQGEEFGESRLAQVLRNNRERAASDILDNVEKVLQDFRSTEQLQDDLTLVVARAR